MYLSRWRPQGKKTMDPCLATRVALRELPADIQHQIMCIVREPPPAPHKKLSARLRSHMARWGDPRRPKITPRTLFT